MATDIIQAHAHSSKNRAAVLASDCCGCFYCLAIFAPREITDWLDEDSTALCPKCSIDAVIGSASGFPIEKDFLKAMNAHWFS